MRITRTKLLSVIGLILAYSCLSTSTLAQGQLDSILCKLDPQKYASAISKKAQNLEEKLVKKSVKVLDNLQKEEEKVYRNLLKTKDSLITQVKLQEIKSKYSSLREKLKNPLSNSSSQYIPKLDSLNTSLKFLTEVGLGGQVKAALNKSISLQDKFNKAEEIKKFIRERRQQLKEQFEKLGMVKQLKKINKEVYYYTQQINEYKEILKDSRKIEKKALELMAKTKLFKDFMRKNSMLAGFFPQPTNISSAQSGFAGLQTRSQVTNYMIQASFSQLPVNIPSGGAQAAGPFSFINSAIGKIKSASSKDFKEEMGFVPNQQKSKFFLKRLEFGLQMQPQKSNRLFPASTDLGLNAGYKLNDKSVIGLGGSFKLGLGNSFSDIRFTGEAFTMRTFIDWKIKGSWWISGGYEQVYQSAFKRFEELQQLDRWQQKGLIGLTRSIPLKSKFLKKTKAQVLWDFLARRRIPRTEVIVIRFGYTFK